MRIILAALAACLFVCYIPAWGDVLFGTPMALGPPVNRGTSQYGASMTADGLELYFNVWVEGHWTDVWVTTRVSKDDEWGLAMSCGLTVNGPAFEWSPRISADGLELYFASNRDGTTYSGFEIFVSRRQSRDDPWQPAEKLGGMINSAFEQTIGSISADGLELYFSSDQKMRVAMRATKDSPWSEVRDIIPTPADETNRRQVGSSMYQSTASTILGESPAISPGGLSLLFSSSSLPGGRGDADIWMMTRPTIHDDWGAPVNLGSPINSPTRERYPWISYDGLSILFTIGGPGCPIFQAPVSPIVDFNGDGTVDSEDLTLLAENWGTNNRLYDIGPFPFGDGVVDEKDLAVFYEYADSDLVMVPTPALGEEGVAVFVGLHWTSGTSDGTYDVYFGTSHADVESASRDNPMGVLVSENQSGNCFALEGPLDFERTYYWRVDEVDLLSDSGIVKGPVWNFTTEAGAGPIHQVVATASSAEEGAGPENTINRSGLDADDQHSVAAEGMWLSAAEGPQPSWIQYEFDTAYPLDAMWVWNYNGQFETVLGMGCKDVTVEYSEDGTAWTTLGDFEFARATAQSDYAHNTVVNFGGAMARCVRLMPRSNWGGISPQYGLSEVRFFYTHPAAIEANASDN